MGKSHGQWFVPPKQYTKIQKYFPTLGKGWPIKTIWYNIMQATEGSFLYPYKLKLEVKNPKKTPRQNTKPFPYKLKLQNDQKETHRQNTKSKGKQKKLANLTKSKLPPKPTYVPPFGGYNNPRPSTSTWPLETSPAVGSRDPLQLGCQIPEQYYQLNPILNTHEVETSSNASGSFYSPSASRSDYSPETTSGSYYSPHTEPISPFSSGGDASDTLAQCMREANLGSQSNTEQMIVPIVTAPEIPMALELVAPVMSPSQGIYDVRNVPEIEEIYDVETDPEIEIMQMPQSPPVELPEIEIVDQVVIVYQNIS